MIDAPRSSQPQLVNLTTQVEGSVDNSPSIEAEKTSKVPLVVLKNASDWTVVCGKLRDRKINYNKAKMTGEGVAITPATPHDYRTLARLLTDEKRELYTNSLPEDKTARAVMRGIPINISNEEIQADLANSGTANHVRPPHAQSTKQQRTTAISTCANHKRAQGKSVQNRPVLYRYISRAACRLP